MLRAEQIFMSSESSPEFLTSLRHQGHSLTRLECTFLEHGPAVQTIHKCGESLCGALLVLNCGISVQANWSPNLTQSTALGESCSGRQERHKLITKQLENARVAGDM